MSTDVLICGAADNPAGPGMSLTTGQPCRNRCIKGAFRCYFHGGASPGSRIKAEQTMALLRMPALESMYEMHAQLCSETCPTCNFPKQTLKEKRLLHSINTAILDRTGLGTRSTLEVVKQSDGDINFNLLTAEEKTQILQLHATMKAIKEAVRKRQAELPGTAATFTANDTTESVH